MVFKKAGNKLRGSGRPVCTGYVDMSPDDRLAYHHSAVKRKRSAFNQVPASMTDLNLER